MNTELDEVVVTDISDEIIEQAAGDAMAGRYTMSVSPVPCSGC